MSHGGIKKIERCVPMWRPVRSSVNCLIGSFSAFSGFHVLNPEKTHTKVLPAGVLCHFGSLNCQCGQKVKKTGDTIVAKIITSD